MNLTRKERGTLLVLLFGAFLSFLNQTLMNVALPSIMRDFNISASQGQWLSNGYMLVSGVMIPTTAFLIERFKTRSLYLFSISMFAAGTLIAGLATSYSFLIVGRMVQAMGAGIIGPLLTVVVMNLFPLSKRGKAMGFIGLAMNFAPAIGPTFSGWIVQSYSWRYLFLLLLPLTIINALLAIFLLTNLGEQKFPKLSLSSVFLSTIGLGALLLGFSNAGDNSWITFDVLGYVLIGLTALILFILLQRKLLNPLLNFKVFTFFKFNISTISSFFVIMGLYGGMLLLPIFLQNVQGITPFKSGLVMLPGALFMAFLSPITGALYDRFGAKYLSFSGLLVLAIGTYLFSILEINTSILYIVIVQTVRSIGLAIALMPLQTEALNALPTELIPHGSAMYNTIRQIAGSIGTATLITIMSLATKSQAAHLANKLSNPAEIAQLSLIHGIQTAYIVTAALTIAAALLTLLFKRKEPLKELIIK